MEVNVIWMFWLPNSFTLGATAGSVLFLSGWMATRRSFNTGEIDLPNHMLLRYNAVQSGL